jgi:hypothetical protein
MEACMARWRVQVESGGCGAHFFFWVSESLTGFFRYSTPSIPSTPSTLYREIIKNKRKDAGEWGLELGRSVQN